MIKNDPNDPFRLVWKEAARGNRSRIAVRLLAYNSAADRWHRHENYWEFVLVLDGSAINETPAGQVSLSSGDLFVMPPGSVHHYVALNHFKHYIILLEPEILTAFPENFSSLPCYRTLFRNEETLPAVLHLSENHLADAVERIEKLQTEYLEQTAGWLESLYAEFFCILVYILRHAQREKTPVNPAAFQIGKAVRYMEKNLKAPHTLQSLSAYVRMSPSNFRLRFREIMGSSPIDYLIRLRLKRAVFLLASTNQPVSELVQQSGFSDSSYFARQFLAAFGRTAREFRLAVQKEKIKPADELKKLHLAAFPG